MCPQWEKKKAQLLQYKHTSKVDPKNCQSNTSKHNSQESSKLYSCWIEPFYWFQGRTVPIQFRVVIRYRFILGICSSHLHFFLSFFFLNSTNTHVYYFNYCAFNTMTELYIRIHASSVPGSIFVRWNFTDSRPYTWFLLYLLKT